MMTRLTKTIVTAALAVGLLAPAGAQETGDELGPFHFTGTVGSVGEERPVTLMVGDTRVQVDADTAVRGAGGVTMPASDLAAGDRVAVRIGDGSTRPKRAAQVRVLSEDAEPDMVEPTLR